MTKKVAIALAARLGFHKAKDVDVLLDFCQRNNLIVGIDNVSSDWVVLTQEGKELGRFA